MQLGVYHLLPFRKEHEHRIACISIVNATWRNTFCNGIVSIYIKASAYKGRRKHRAKYCHQTSRTLKYDTTIQQIYPCPKWFPSTRVCSQTSKSRPPLAFSLSAQIYNYSFSQKHINMSTVESLSIWRWTIQISSDATTCKVARKMKERGLKNPYFAITKWKWMAQYFRVQGAPQVCRAVKHHDTNLGLVQCPHWSLHLLTYTHQHGILIIYQSSTFK